MDSETSRLECEETRWVRAGSDKWINDADSKFLKVE